MKTYINLLREIIKRNKRQTTICFLIMLVMSVFQVVIPLAMKGMVAQIEEYESVQVFIICIGIYAFMWLIYNLINVKWYKHIDILGEKVLWFVREEIYNVIWNCDYTTYFTYNKEYLKNVLFTDVINIYGNIILYSLNVLADLFMIVIFLGVSFYVDVTTTVILVLAVAIGFLLSFSTKPIMSEYSMRVNKALKKDNAVNNECVDAIELIRTNGLQDYYKGKVQRSIHEFIEVAIQSDQKTVFLQNLMSHYHQIMVMVITGFLVLNAKDINAGTLVYYIYVTNLIIEKSQTIEGNLYKFMKNMAAFENIDKIMKTEVTTNADGKELSDVSEIVFDHVSLSYENGTEVLKNKSFTMRKGEAILIKGENGSGKSTVLKMITGLISPNSGEIKYNGISFKDINRQSLYKSICYLNQEELLLNENLQDYLSVMSHKEISESEYHEYASRVHLTKEYGTISDNGRSFSGGEKKKAIIMKLLAREKEASVILLDEIEAGLDKTSQELLDEIEAELLAKKDKYIIIKISHGNIGNIEAYDKVIEL